MSNLFLILSISLISYLLGSFPTAYLVVKKFTGKDIREIGSANVGAFNTFRAFEEKGKSKALIGFLIVLLIDMAKGMLAIFSTEKILEYFNSNFILAITLASYFVILGHNYSIFLNFSGGRGAASLMGIMLYLKPISILVWGLPIVFSTILVQIILEKMRKEEKINWKNFSDLFKMFGKQMAGRMLGLILAPLFLYFYAPSIFSPISAGTILLLIRNIPRFEDYFQKIKIKRK